MLTKDPASVPFSTPAPNRTIQSLVTQWEVPILQTYRHLIESAKERGLGEQIVEKYRAAFTPVIAVGGESVFPPETTLELASAAVISIWMLAKQDLGHKNQLTYEDAEAWFFGQDNQGKLGLHSDMWTNLAVFERLEAKKFGKSFFELMPYVLELFQTDDHDQSLEIASTRRDKRKRIEGVFYTPSDVAEYIVEEVGANWDHGATLPLSNRTWLDPSCGAGVFFLAILKRAQLQGSLLSLATNNLYGIDKSPFAIQSCAFTVVNYLAVQAHREGLSGWRLWQAVRSNLAVADSTLIGGIGSSDVANSQLRMRVRTLEKRAVLEGISNSICIEDTKAQSARLPACGGTTEQEVAYRFLGDLFPECENGVDFLIGNPPYSASTDEKFQRIRARIFESSAPGKDGNIFTLFIEMMWKFTRAQESKAGLVVPLSIAYSNNRCCRVIRSLIEKSFARFRFSFFDRTPDSLFGDAVKTRNCIILMDSKTGPQTIIETGAILRWTSRNRYQLFGSISYAMLDSLPIGDFIPKLGSDLEVGVYETMRGYDRIGSMWNGVTFSRFVGREEDRSNVYYYNLAYNWLSVFRAIPIDEDNDSSISRSLKGLWCKGELEADFVFAVLSSRLPYWLWRVEGDGFHVTLSFLNRIPIHISRFSSEAVGTIRALSAELWRSLILNPMVSVNAGRRTINYTPENCSYIVDELDMLVIRGLNLPEAFCPYLKNFVTENIIVGRHMEIQLKTQKKKDTDGSAKR